MESIFGLVGTPEFEEALDKTFEKFEAMPAKELFALARQHSDGDIAKFVSAWSEITLGHADETPATKEISLFFKSEDPSLSSFNAVFTHESTMNFQTPNFGCHEYQCYCAVPSAVAIAEIPAAAYLLAA